MKMYNLNHPGNTIFISSFEFGKTQNIEVKIGRKFYLLDIDKDRDSTFITFYKKLNSDRRKFSKYSSESDPSHILIKNNSMLDRRFFENIKEIEKAQYIYSRFKCLK